jgi:4-carboxymuconolactone decarboxylase
VEAAPVSEDKRQVGLEMMRQVYGWDVEDGPGDFFAMTVDHLFAEVWTRPGLTQKERRLLLIGLLVGMNLDDVLGIQIDSALKLKELSPDQLREIAIFLTHYAGWPRGAKINMAFEELIARYAES